MGIEVIAGENVEGLPISEAVVAGDFIFVSGMVGFDHDGAIVEGGVGEETRYILGELRSVLSRCKASLDDVVKVNAHLVNPDDFEEFNKVYAAEFSSHRPARITVCSGMTIGAKVEMDFVAYKKTG